MRIKNYKHYTEEQQELIHDIINVINALPDKAKNIYLGEQSNSDKVYMLDYLSTQCATLSNLVLNVFRYEVRTDDDELVPNIAFNKILGYKKLLERELKNES